MQQTCDWIGGVSHKGILSWHNRLAQHGHLQLLVLQACLAQARHSPGVPFRCPDCLDCMPHVLPGGAAAIPLDACRLQTTGCRPYVPKVGGGERMYPKTRTSNSTNLYYDRLQTISCRAHVADCSSCDWMYNAATDGKSTNFIHLLLHIIWLQPTNQSTFPVLQDSPAESTDNNWETSERFEFE